MQNFSTHLALILIDLIVGGLVYLCCRWMFIFYKILPTIIFWICIFIVGGRNALAFSVWGTILLIPIIVFTGSSMYFLSEASPTEDKEFQRVLAYAALFPAHILCFFLYFIVHDYSPVRYFIGGYSSHFDLLYLILMFFSPTLAAFVVWEWEKRRPTLRRG